MPCATSAVPARPTPIHTASVAASAPVSTAGKAGGAPSASAGRGTSAGSGAGRSVPTQKSRYHAHARGGGAAPKLPSSSGRAFSSVASAAAGPPAAASAATASSTANPAITAALHGVRHQAGAHPAEGGVGGGREHRGDRRGCARHAAGSPRRAPRPPAPAPPARRRSRTTTTAPRAALVARPPKRPAEQLGDGQRAVLLRPARRPARRPPSTAAPRSAARRG